MIPPSDVRMASVLDVQTDSPLRGPSNCSSNVVGPSRVDDIARVFSESTALLPGVWVAADARSVRKNRQAWAVRPNGVADAGGIL